MRRSARVRHHLHLLPLAAALSCGGGRAPAPSTAPRARPAEQRSTRLPDANTAAILLASHQADLAAARIAGTRARHRDVKLLARSMVTDHAGMSSTLSRLVADIGLTPREDDVSRLLREQSVAQRDTLRDLSGPTFDSAYVESEVRHHEEILVAMDRVFLPSARNARLKEYLTTMRAEITAHLSLAEQVRRTIAAAR
jgi:putative membrane protein